MQGKQRLKLTYWPGRICEQICTQCSACLPAQPGQHTGQINKQAHLIRPLESAINYILANKLHCSELFRISLATVCLDFLLEISYKKFLWQEAISHRELLVWHIWANHFS